MTQNLTKRDRHVNGVRTNSSPRSVTTPVGPGRLTLPPTHQPPPFTPRHLHGSDDGPTRPSAQTRYPNPQDRGNRPGSSRFLECVMSLRREIYSDPRGRTGSTHIVAQIRVSSLLGFPMPSYNQRSMLRGEYQTRPLTCGRYSQPPACSTRPHNLLFLAKVAVFKCPRLLTFQQDSSSRRPSPVPILNRIGCSQLRKQVI